MTWGKFREGVYLTCAQVSFEPLSHAVHKRTADVYPHQRHLQNTGWDRGKGYAGSYTIIIVWTLHRNSFFISHQQTVNHSCDKRTHVLRIKPGSHCRGFGKHFKSDLGVLNGFKKCWIKPSPPSFCWLSRQPTLWKVMLSSWRNPSLSSSVLITLMSGWAVTHWHKYCT